MTFPDDWPAGCPPDDAEPAEGVVYRLVKTNPPSAGDFETHHEKGTLKKADACLRCGLSVFRIKADVEHQHRAYPKLGKFIAEGNLEAEHGVTKQTGKPSHTTWWSYVGLDRMIVFVRIEEIV